MPTMMMTHLHEMSDEASDLIPQLLAGYDSDLFADSFVRVEVVRESRVILLDDADDDDDSPS